MTSASRLAFPTPPPSKSTSSQNLASIYRIPKEGVVDPSVQVVEPPLPVRYHTICFSFDVLHTSSFFHLCRFEFPCLKKVIMITVDLPFCPVGFRLITLPLRQRMPLSLSRASFFYRAFCDPIAIINLVVFTSWCFVLMMVCKNK